MQLSKGPKTFLFVLSYAYTLYFFKITHFAFAIGSLTPCFTKKKEKKRTKFFLCEYHIVLDLAFNRIIVKSRGKMCEGNERD
jgi:hypothetical protein